MQLANLSRDRSIGKTGQIQGLDSDRTFAMIKIDCDVDRELKDAFYAHAQGRRWHEGIGRADWQRECVEARVL